MKIKSKLPKVGTTIFTVMSKMANDYNAINLAQGFPNFPVDERLTKILSDVSQENGHQYAPMAGNPKLIESIIDLTQSQYLRKISANEVLITAGATQGIFTTIQALVHENDEVIIIDPAYDCYRPALDLVKAKTTHVAMEDDFSIDWNKINEVINNNTKLLIINNPHNPSGKVFNQSDINSLKEIMLKNEQLLLLSDEVYEYISFEQKHISINSIPELCNRTIIISSFGKTFHITGWKIGYLLAPEYLMNEIKKVHQFLVFSVNSISQVALKKYLEVVNVNQLGSFYQQKRDFFRSLLKKSNFDLLPCDGTYFQTVSYSSISKLNDVDFANYLVKEKGVATIPMSVFYESRKDNKHLRFCFAKDNETILKSTELLCKI
jgi:methionine transaminase